MKIYKINGQNYLLPSVLNDFQTKMYVHLINWKWKNITTERGKARGNEYDAILPDRYADMFPILYPQVVYAVKAHRQRFPFRIHKYFNHMASSQAANINLFLPVLLHPGADAIFSAVNPQFARMATEYLDRGWRIEYWDEPYGRLGDKSKMAGTDADLAIAYYNHTGKLCLWLIEHKLTEAEFTTCGGFVSEGRKERHDCTQSFSEILKNKNICYYHDIRKFNYWNITETNHDSFVNHSKYAQCPFQGGMNQLWRNHLLALVVEQNEQQPYEYTSFSVVRHPDNIHLNRSLHEYKELIGNNPKFSTFTSVDIINAAENNGDSQLVNWVKWYKGLYNL